MDVLWDRGEWLSTAGVRLALDRPVAPTTVATVLGRLEGKGWLERRQVGKNYEYRAVQTREEHLAWRMGEILDTAHDRGLTLLEFVDRLRTDEQSRLRRMLKK